MKKIIALLLCLATALALISCSAGDGKDTDSAATETEDGEYAKVDGSVPVIKVGDVEFTLAEFNLHFRTLPLSIASEYRYYYGDQYQQALYEAEGLDITASYKDQPCPYFDGSYYDYFLDMTRSTCTDMATLCYYAEQNGIELDEDELSAIDTSVGNIVSSCASYSISVAEYYDDSMNLTTEDVIRSYYKKYTLARKARSTFATELALNDEKVAKEYAENPNAYAVVDFLAYTVAANDYVTEADVTTYSDKIMSSASVEEFVNNANEYNKVYNTGKENVKDITLDSIIYRNISYNKGGDAIDWLFSKDTKTGDTYKAFNSEAKSCTVYMLMTPAHLNDYDAKSVRHILLMSSKYDTDEACLAEAERILAEYSENPTEDNFAALANKYSDDGRETDENGDAKEKTDGGIYENVAPGTMVWEFDKWLFDDERKPGDTGIVKTSFGYHVMYFVGTGDRVTKSGSDKIKSALLQRAVDEYKETLEPTFDDVFVKENLDA